MAATAMAGAATESPHVMEAKKIEYFSSINSMARKIMQEREKIKESFGSDWDSMSPAEQDAAIDDGMMEPKIRTRYAMHRMSRDEMTCYPKLLLQTGQKIVHFGEEDLTWQDEHSSPFSWETKSQMEFSMITGAPETSSTTTTAAASAAGTSSTSSASEVKPRASQGSKLSAVEAPGPESSFWKISAERSRLEGEKSDFHSITPSQIKSLEKGEKPLPSYLRSESGVRDPEEPPAPRPVRQRAPKPPAPPPPVPMAPISVTPAAAAAPAPPPPVAATASSVSVAAGVGGWERAQSTLPSVSSNADDDVFSPGLAGEKVDASPAASPTFSQFNTSSSILKTGFDFLDNW